MADDTARHSFTVKVNGDLRTIRASTMEEYQLCRAEAIDNLQGDLELSLLAQQVSAAAPLINHGQPAPQAPVQPPTYAPPTAPPTPQGVVQQDPWPQQAPQQQAPQQGHVCDCGLPMKYVAGGISKKTGNPYSAFYACSKPQGQQCRKSVKVG